jgi:uncharacterized membrane protein
MEESQNKLMRFFTMLPAILLMTFANVFITSAVAGVIMLELQAAYPGSRWPLGVAILVAVAVYCWINFNHKLRNYINKQGNTNEH